MPPSTLPCPCGRLRPFDDCCGPILVGGAARTAEDLMRSRYTAYAIGDAEHLLSSWDPETRPAAVELDPAIRWRGLEIIETTAGNLLDATGTVEFIAHLSRDGRKHEQHERSRFRRHQGRWVYTDGDRDTNPASG